MSILLQQLAMDAGLSDNELIGRSYDAQNLAKVCLQDKSLSDHDGYGVNLRAADQRYSDEIFIAKNDMEYRAALHSLHNQIAGDAAVYSPPSNGVLEYYTTVFNNKLIKQILKTTPLRQLTDDWQQGQFGTTDLNVPTISYAGNSQVYADDSGQGGSSINVAWVPRQAVTLQRTLKYGDLTQAQFGMAKIDYVGQMREGLAALTNLDINNIGFRGFDGMNIYGLLNDPSLNAAIVAPASVANPASSLWFYKTYDEIINDIRSMFNSIIQIAGGNADYTSPCKLGLPPACYTALTKQNALGTQTVEGYCKSVFPGMEIIQVPNYQGTGSPVGSVIPNKAQLIMKELAGQPVAYNVFSQLYNSHGVVRLISSYAEKISYTISGAFVALPIGIATITGI